MARSDPTQSPGPTLSTEEVRVFTRRIFDGVLITMLAGQLAFGLPRMWARKEMASGASSKLKRLAGAAVLHATS